MAKYSGGDFEGTFWTILDADFYVSTIGNDVTGDGSPKKPLLTVKKAYSIASNGEKIITGPDHYINVVAENANTSNSNFPCRLATTSHINLSVGRLLNIDGITTKAKDRVLVWHQNNPKENGIYLANAGTWERAEDFNNVENIISGKLIPVVEGFQYNESVFQLTTSEEIYLGTTHLNFTLTGVPH